MSLSVKESTLNRVFKGTGLTYKVAIDDNDEDPLPATVH